MLIPQDKPTCANFVYCMHAYTRCTEAGYRTLICVSKRERQKRKRERESEREREREKETERKREKEREW